MTHGCLEGQAHYWNLTIILIDNVSHTHYECKRCGAQKDEPNTSKMTTGRWRPTQKPPRKAPVDLATEAFKQHVREMRDSGP